MIAYDTGRKRRSEDETGDRVGQKWKKLRGKVHPCPNCNSCRQWLSRSLMNRIKRYHIECDVCYWCGKSMPTIRMAIRMWNREKGPELADTCYATRYCHRQLKMEDGEADAIRKWNQRSEVPKE